MMKWQPGWQSWQATPEATLHTFCAGSESDGPTVLVSAGIHGDEYEGPAAVAALASTLKHQTLHGRVLLVPVMNPVARLSGTRLTPQDGKNLARCFPGRHEGSFSERLAAAIFEHLVTPSDFVIDLHSGGVEYLFLPVAGFYGDVDPANASYRAAVRFGLPSMWQLPPTPGVLSYEATRRGKIAIGNEYLGAGQLSREGTLAYAKGTMNCLQDWSVFGNDVPEAVAQPRCFTGDWLLSGTTGLFVSQVGLGSEVERGALLAEIRNECGDVLEAFHAPFSGEVLGVRSKSHIQQGAWAVLLGMRNDLV